MTENPLNITFGVEIELALAFFPSEQEDPSLDWRHEGQESIDDPETFEKAENVIRGSVVRILREAGIETNKCKTLDVAKDDQDYTKWSVTCEQSVKIDKKQITQWGNDSPLNLSPTQHAEIRFLDIEVVSGVLNFHADALDEIQTAITAIVSNLPVVVPHNNGLHVHVGNQSSGLPTETLKNIMTLVSCMEDQFNQLHPPLRLQNHNIILPRFNFHRQNRGDAVRMAEFISRRADLPDFLHYFGWNRRVCYNFENLHPRKKKKTVEFRQHLSTLDIREIKQWILLVCNLVNIAHQAESGLIIDVLRRRAYDSGYDVIDLLKDLGMFASARYYSTRIYKHPPDMHQYNPETEVITHVGWKTPESRDKYYRR